MLDMSWGEVMLIGGVALIVIGPKDLPKALRTVGQVTTKLRRMAGEFQMQFNEAIREAELDEVRKEVDGIRNAARSTSAFNPVQTIRDELKGAVEGRTKPAETKSAENKSAETRIAGGEIADAQTTIVGSTAAADPALGASPAEAGEIDGGMGPHRPAEADRPAAPSLADATAQLRAEQGAESGSPPEPAAPAGPARIAAHEPALPVPGSVDDPFGVPPEPAPEPAKRGTGAR